MLYIKLNIQRFADGDIIIGTKVDTSGIKDGVEDIKDIVDKKPIDIKADKQSKGMKAISNFATKIASKFTGISISSLKFLGNIVKIVGGLGIVSGILGALVLAGIGLGSAFSKALEKDEELKAQLEGIRTTLANAFLPLAEKILGVIKNILYYIGYILKAWFGINIFSKNNEKSLNKAVGSAKQLNKQLAGFDEMNVLSDNSSSGAGASSSNFELPEPEDVDVPKWIKWIAENKKLILGTLAGIALGLLAIKLADPTTWIVLAISALAVLITWIIKNWDKVKSILITVGSWIYDNVIKPVVNFFVWLWNKIVEIVTPIVEFFKSIFTTVWINIKTSIENIAKIFSWLWARIKEIFSPVVNFFYNIFKKAGEALQPFINAVVGLWDKVKGALKQFGVKVGEVIGGTFKLAFNGIMKIIETFLNTPIKAINKLIKVINKVPGINLDKLSEFKLPRLERGGIVHNPGAGVMMGNYIAGEGRDSEAVIPLNDATMDRLGEAIARHMNINNENNIYLNARQIARQISITNAERNFAMNG